MPCWSPLRCWVGFPVVRNQRARGSVGNTPARSSRADASSVAATPGRRRDCCACADRAAPKRTRRTGTARSCPSTLGGDQGRLEIAAAGGADRRSAKNAARPMNQTREAHLAARPLQPPSGAYPAGTAHPTGEGYAGSRRRVPRRVQRRGSGLGEDCPAAGTARGCGACREAARAESACPPCHRPWPARRGPGQASARLSAPPTCRRSWWPVRRGEGSPPGPPSSRWRRGQGEASIVVKLRWREPLVGVALIGPVSTGRAAGVFQAWVRRSSYACAGKRWTGSGWRSG